MQFDKKEPTRGKAEQPPQIQHALPEAQQPARSTNGVDMRGGLSAPAGSAARLQALFEGYSAGSSPPVQLKATTGQRGAGAAGRSSGDRSQQLKAVDDRIAGLRSGPIATLRGCIDQIMKRLDRIEQQRRELFLWQLKERRALANERDALLAELTGGGTDHVGNLLRDYATVERLQRKREMIQDGLLAPADEATIPLSEATVGEIKDSVWRHVGLLHRASYPTLRSYIDQWSPAGAR